jgi:hypothetical protein
MRCVPALFLASVSLAATVAHADPCDDYFGRHYKTDVAPVRVVSYPTTHQGDITLSPSVRITVQNVGTYAIADLAGPGSLIHARQVAVSLKGRTFSGFLPAPLSPGASADVSISIPEGFLGTCERVSATIDVDNALGQSGCQVKSNDTIDFQAFFNPRLCVIIHREFPRPESLDADGADVDTGAAEEATEAL